MDDKPITPMVPITRLGNRFRAELAPLGIHVQQFVVIPNDDPDGPHHAQAVLIIDEDKPEPVVVVTSNPEFDDMADRAIEANETERAEAARADLEKLMEDLKNPKKGLGLD